MRPLFGAMLLALLLSPASARSDGLLDFAIKQWKARPEMRVEDAYKWLFHATQGGEHAIASSDGPRQWLDDEWKTLGKPAKGEALAEPLTPDGSILRLNLRPYRALGGEKEPLLNAFVQSARRFKPDRSRFERVWRELGQRLRRSRIGKLSSKDWTRLDRAARPAGYPAWEHSNQYEKAYRPAYRVVLRSTVRGFLDRHKGGGNIKATPEDE